MTMKFPRGSEWRKWDLHVHAPGEKMADGYKKLGADIDWKKYCQLIHESDVAVIGITDYFRLDAFFEFKKQWAKTYPDDESKVFFPNLELRLPEAVNKDAQSINIHLIFRPDLTPAVAQKLAMAMKTETTAGKSRKTVTCADLDTVDEFESATVSRSSIHDALKHVFGEGYSENDVLIVTSAKGDGIRSGGKGSRKRKDLLVDEIDKFSHAFFGGADSRGYFLNCDRLEAEEQVSAKPVFAGSDAHSFGDLETRLGKQGESAGEKFEITWVKADPIWEGLLQCLIEPADRVATRFAQPDEKQPYQYISKIKFSSTTDFPSEIVFNPNLNSIIGSRSSGKSALLAFIAHAVDPVGTVEQQVEGGGADRKDAGPAAGKSWSDVEGIKREIEWGSSSASGGKVVYIPQNSLYSLSEHPDKVTEKIAPALFRGHSGFRVSYQNALANVDAANEEIRLATSAWFVLDDELLQLDADIKDLGDEEAIKAARDELQGQIDDIKRESNLTDAEVAAYQEVANLLGSHETRINEIDDDIAKLAAYVEIGALEGSAISIAGAVEIAVSVRPTASQVPEEVSDAIEKLRTESVANLTTSVETILIDAFERLTAERKETSEAITSITSENADLMTRYAANVGLEVVVTNHEKQIKALKAIEKKQSSRARKVKSQEAEAKRIGDALNKRASTYAELETQFSSVARKLDDLTFGIETGIDLERASELSSAFNRSKISPYVKKKGDDFDFARAQSSPGDFLHDLASGAQELNKGNGMEDAALEVFRVAPEVRFTAVLDADKIGGFERSSMTPGKQALFALTLILNESDEPWPILIDQPEDDLDSRSIYDTIVPYLVRRKRERQIIMVSHDANLVIGADSEELVVANRHGADRPNAGARMFEYLTGSLEHSQALNPKSATVLGRFGIREHACEILDGGESAFQKRRDKYKI